MKRRTRTRLSFGSALLGGFKLNELESAGNPSVKRSFDVKRRRMAIISWLFSLPGNGRCGLGIN
jgi:hypothetical protein